MSIDREALAAALRRARTRVTPEEVGLPAGLRRRVPGLRREEVALAAGISVDYVVRLEQARGPHPSDQVVAALARALRLEDDERDHVFRLAGLAPPRAGTIDRHVRPAVLRMIDRFADLPVLVLSAVSDVLAWNAMSSALYGDWSAVAPERRNQMRLRFLPLPEDAGRSMAGVGEGGWEETSRRSVGHLRAASGRYPDDEGLAQLVADLEVGSEEFRRLWPETDATPWRAQTKAIEHRQLGRIELDCQTLLLPDTDQSLVVYSAAPGSPAAASLELLRVVGTQELTDAARPQQANAGRTIPG